MCVIGNLLPSTPSTRGVPTLHVALKFLWAEIESRSIQFFNEGYGTRLKQKNVAETWEKENTHYTLYSGRFQEPTKFVK